MEMTAKVKLLDFYLTLKVTSIKEKTICSASTWARVSMVSLVKLAIWTTNRDREKWNTLPMPHLWTEREADVLKSLADKACLLLDPSLNLQVEGPQQLEPHPRVLTMEFS
jgi:hypothetical protein